MGTFIILFFLVLYVGIFLLYKDKWMENTFVERVRTIRWPDVYVPMTKEEVAEQAEVFKYWYDKMRADNIQFRGHEHVIGCLEWTIRDLFYQQLNEPDYFTFLEGYMINNPETGEIYRARRNTNSTPDFDPYSWELVALRPEETGIDFDVKDWEPDLLVFDALPPLETVDEGEVVVLATFEFRRKWVNNGERWAPASRMWVELPSFNFTDGLDWVEGQRAVLDDKFDPCNGMIFEFNNGEWKFRRDYDNKENWPFNGVTPDQWLDYFSIDMGQWEEA
ncbi:hypothetical protein SM033_00032 [Vibrio phage vB_VpaM_sm033]|nr:hypothetical protein SM033_00032 [Vibrio phage vB_VpaM_sm033]